MLCRFRTPRARGGWGERAGRAGGGAGGGCGGIGQKKQAKKNTKNPRKNCRIFVAVAFYFTKIAT